MGASLAWRPEIGWCLSFVWTMRGLHSRDSREGRPLQAREAWTVKASGFVGGQNKGTAWDAVSGRRRVDREAVSS